MPPPQICPQCGAELKGRGLGGLCHRCVGIEVLASDEGDLHAAGEDEDQGRTPLETQAVSDSSQEQDLVAISGRYRVLRQIGEGGFGEVYLAKQAEPVKRQVAVKVIKPGMASEQVVARFEAESQALALMEHPNIAKVFDGGVTTSGRPYFVMELVCGIPITVYCDKHQLSVQERLKLFIQVCHAIQHAHQKGIIHRDLKPSNILVADEGTVRKAEGRCEQRQARPLSATHNDHSLSTIHQPLLKVIDFGIAKATGAMDLTEQTVFTAYQQFMGSPSYMSPEQAEMNGLDLDTRSDIYSLGVLLYELLTGQTPFDGKTLLRRGIEELILTLRDVEPPRPSARLGTMPAGCLTTQARRHKTDPIRLRRMVQGDLDWIVMKCLEKDRTRRYETANALAMDVQRHLDQEPVLAVAPSRIYRLRKLVQRNRLTFTAGVTVTLALVLGLVASLWQAAKAAESERQQRVLRQQAQARAYAANMNLAQQALAMNNLGRTRMLLDRYRPNNQFEIRNPKSGLDLRGWEWRYLWQLSRSEALATLCRTSNWVFSLSISADGNWLAVGEMHDGGLSVWDLKANKKVATLLGGVDQVQVAFSPNEPLLAFSAITSPSVNELKSSVFLWDGSTREIVAELPLRGSCEGLAFSGDGAKLAIFAGGSESHVSLWQVADGALLTAYSTVTIQDSPGHKVAFDRDLTVAAFGLTEGRIRIVDALTGTERRTVTVPDGIVNAVALSADGNLLAGATGFDDGMLYLWEVETGHQIARVAAHRGRIDTLHFWPDGKRLASGSSDQTLLVWDLANLPELTVLRRLQGHRRTVRDVAFLPDNSTVASGSEDKSVLLWDTKSARQDHSHIALSGAFVAWQWASDSRSVTTLDTNGRVVRWHGNDFREETNLLETSSNLFWGTFSSDLKRLATSSDKGTMQIWEISPRKLLIEFDGGLWPRKFFSDKNRLIVKDSRDGRIKEWSLADGRELDSWGSQGRLLGSILSMDERWLVRLRQRDQLRLTDRTMHQEIPLNPPIRGAYGAAFSADGTHVAIASYFGLARVWETSTGREVATFTGFEQGVHSAGFSPDGKRLATTSQGAEAVRLWSLVSLQELLTLSAREEIFVSTQFSPNGNVLGAMHYKQGLHLWRAPSWEEIENAEASGK